MSTIRTLILSAAAITAVGGAVVAGSTAVNAQEGSTNMAERIASKFNLNKDEVQKVIDSVHEERQAERNQEISERLQEKVEAGDITAEQKTKIEAKLKELQDKRETERDALEQWAEENNIALKYLLGGRHHGAMHGNDDRLQDAVDNGDITAEQKTKIEAKLKELQDKRETERDALEQWAEENNLELRDIMPFGGGHGPKGMGGHMRG